MAAELGQKMLSSRVLRKVAKQSEGLLRLPESLTSAIAAFVAEYPSQEMKRNVARLSAVLRKKDSKFDVDDEIEESNHNHKLLELTVRPSLKDLRKDLLPGHSTVTYEEGYTAAYIASRMPGVYATIYRVFCEVFQRVPDFKPSNILDYGSGPGTVVWALRAVCPDAAVQVNAVESSRAMALACRKLLQDKEGSPPIRHYKSLQDLQRSISQAERGHDLVVSSYALGESQTMKERISIVRQLWALTRDILILIEPGTPAGSKLIRESRAHILALERKKFLRQKSDINISSDSRDADNKGTSLRQNMPVNAFVVAPCPHDGVCPMDKTSRWCHFVQRLERTPSLRTVKRVDRKGALRGYEDEKFSYVVLRRGSRPRIPWPLDGVEVRFSDDEQQEDFKFDDYDSQSDGYNSDDVVRATQSVEEHDNMEKSEVSSDQEEDKEDCEDLDSNIDDGEKQVADLGSGWARIVFEPIRRGKHVFLDVCCSTKRDGSEGKLDRLILTRSRDAVLHKQAKKSRWGDLWPCR